MNATVAVAALGFASTLVGSWLSAHLQRRGARAAQILDARVRVYGDCATNLYEYERASYNRVKARLDSRPESEREALRQEAYRCNALSRAAIGQVAILSGTASLHDQLEAARAGIGDMNKADDQPDLRQRHDLLQAALTRALGDAQVALMR
jgi:hypothetical protein